MLHYSTRRAARVACVSTVIGRKYQVSWKEKKQPHKILSAAGRRSRAGAPRGALITVTHSHTASPKPAAASKVDGAVDGVRYARLREAREQRGRVVYVEEAVDDEALHGLAPVCVRDEQRDVRVAARGGDDGV